MSDLTVFTVTQCVQSRCYLVSHDDWNECVKEVELCHGDGDGHLEQSETAESDWDEFF